MKISALLFSLFAFSNCSHADFAYYSNRHMAQISDLIVVGTAKVVENGKFYQYKQKVFFEVETYIKGSSSKNIVILGNTDFICDMTKFEKGRYLLFLRQRENQIFEYNIESTFVSVNFENGVREFSDNKIWWRSQKLASNMGSYKKLEVVSAEVNELTKVPWNMNIY